MIRAKAIFKKQLKDTFKNKEVLIQFVMFPFMAFLMTNAIDVKDMPPNYFVTLFASMYLAMTPITSMAAIIAEEKEKGTLRVLMMSNVKPSEYLLGVGSYLWIICMLGTFAFAKVANYKGIELVHFFMVMAIGVLISTVIGAVIGVWSKNQMMATSLTVPVMMVFSFLPMLATFNDTIKKFGTIVYSVRINQLMNQIGMMKVGLTDIVIVACNALLMIGLFVFVYRKKGLIC